MQPAWLCLLPGKLRRQPCGISVTGWPNSEGESKKGPSEKNPIKGKDCSFPSPQRMIAGPRGCGPTSSPLTSTLTLITKTPGDREPHGAAGIVSPG